MKTATLKITDASASVEIAAMPEHQQDALARTLIGCISRLFENPDIKNDYERWKKEKYKQ